MLRTQRPDLPAALQAELDDRQNTVNDGETDDMAWSNFRDKHRDSYNDLKDTLKAMLHGKCAYCERADANQIEHYWPKSPTVQNAKRGTPTRMYTWDNLLLACETCNGFGCKGSRMEWANDGQPKLINPCQDDPLCYLDINLMEEVEIRRGFILPRTGLNQADSDRAKYTIRLLKLNQRDGLRRGRAKAIIRFLAFVRFLEEFGADCEAFSGHTLREILLQMLGPSTPYLAVIRQILFRESDFAGLRQRLLDEIPELATRLDIWALPPEDCTDD